MVYIKVIEGEVIFGRVLMKPGKPMTFAKVKIEDKLKLVFALPGNPVSSFVCFNLFVKPAIRTIMGFETPTDPVVNVEVMIFLLFIYSLHMILEQIRKDQNIIGPL